MLRFAALLAPLALAACAAAGTQEAADRDCFRPDLARGFHFVDDNTIGVSVGARDYLLTTRLNARELNFTQAVRITAADAWVCAGEPYNVEIVGGAPARRFAVTQIARAPEAGS